MLVAWLLAVCCDTLDAKSCDHQVVKHPCETQVLHATHFIKLKLSTKVDL